jgi:hypothetical protein
MKYADGGLYDGQWAGDERHGTGKMTLPNGNDTYEGQWCNGRRHGTGRFVWCNGVAEGSVTTAAAATSAGTYTGAVLNDKRHGWGLHEYANGNQVSTEYRDNRPVDGHADSWMQFANGDLFYGFFKNGQPTCNATDVIVFANGDRYVGLWGWSQLNGGYARGNLLPNGAGTMTYKTPEGSSRGRA